MKRNRNVLTAMVLVGLMAGLGAPDVFAETYTGNSITGTVNDSAWLNGGSTVTKESDGTISYELQGDNTILGKSGLGFSTSSITFQAPKTQIKTGGTLTLQPTSNFDRGDTANLISVADGSTALIDGDIKGILNDIAKGDTYLLSGINFGVGYQSSRAQGAHLSVDGKLDFDIKTSGLINGGYHATDGYNGSRWAPAAIYGGLGGGSTIDLKGDVSIKVGGIGIQLDPYYAQEGFDDYDLITANLNGGTINIQTYDSTRDAYYAVGNFGGTVNINVTANGKDAKNYIAGSHDVLIKGNMIVTDNSTGAGDSFYYRSGRINLGLTTKNSYWKGVIDNTGASQAGEFNLWLKNDANWFHTPDTKTNGMDAGHMPSPSNENHYGIYDGASHVNWLHGSDGRGEGGFITQSAAKLDIKNYSGFTTVIYDHTNNGTSVNDYAGGDVTIHHAEAGSGITLSTSSKNIAMGDKGQVAKVLDALAQKLVYSGYTSGEENLTGRVQIASGLLSTSDAIMIGKIDFDKATGRGGNTDGGTSAVVSYQDAALTGDPSKDQAYVASGVLKKDGTYEFTDSTDIKMSDAKSVIDTNKDMTINAEGSILSLSSSGEKGPPSDLAATVNQGGGTLSITAKNLNITMDRTNNRWATGITMGAMGESGERNLNITGDVNISATGGNAVMGMYLLSGSHAVINGNLTVKAQNNSEVTGDLGHYHTNGLYAGFGNSSIMVNGDVDITSNGTGVQANTNSMIDLNGGGKITIAESNKADQYALEAEAATVNMNVTKGSDGQVKAAGTNQVNITGNLGILNKDKGAAPNEDNASTVINLGLSTKDSTLHGVAFNEFEEEEAAGKSIGYALDVPVSQEINLYISNGATWTNERYGMVKEGFTGSHLANLRGGFSARDAGYIIQKDSGDLTIDNYNGHMVIVYDHENEGTKDSDYKAGNTVIKSAGIDSGVTLSTSSANVNMDDKGSVEKTLAALAHKLLYQGAGAENQLSGQVQIASGLTSTSIAKKLGDMTFDAKNGGQGTYVEGSVKDVNASIVGNTESEMMKGVRSAVTTAAFSFRDAASDVLHRTELLKDGTLSGDGIWAKTYGGKSKYTTDTLGTKYSYWGAQVGYDKDLSNGWHAGVGVDYQDGSGTYLRRGNGDGKLYTLGVYANKDLGDGAYLDAAIKAGHVENRYDVYNEIGEKLAGAYSTNGYSASLQYGKRIGKETYVEPQVQLTYAHLQGASHEADSSLGIMHVDQDAFDSLVGRVGLEIGSQNNRGGFYGRVSIAHEFKGELNTRYRDDAGGHKSTTFDLGDTWSELTLGGQYQVNNDTRVYADLTRSIGGDYQSQWKANAGIRVFLGSGIAPGRNKEKSSVLSAAPVSSKTQRTTPETTVSLASGNSVRGPLVGGTSAAAGGSGTSMSLHSSLVGNTYAVPENASEESTTYKGMSAYSAPSGYDNGTVFELAPVVVTANRVPQPIFEAKADISVVTRKEIDDMHMETVEDALRTVPGLQFLNYGSNGLNANLSGVRINGSKDIVLLVDGVRVTDFLGVNMSGYVYASLLNNLDNIERIEVLRGSAGAQYGSAAKGGVINIITRKVNDTKTIIDVAAGNFGKRDYKFNTQGRKDKFSYNVYYSRKISGTMKDGAGVTWEGHTRTNSEGAKFIYDFSRDNTLSLNYEELSSKFHGFDNVYKGPYNGTYETHAFTLQHNWKLSDLWHNMMSYRKSTLKSFYDDPDPLSSTGRTIIKSNYDYDFFSDQLTYTSDRHTLTFGIDYSGAKDRDITTVDDGKGHLFQVHRKLSNVSYYAQEDWKLLPYLTLSGGIRYDQPDGDSYSPDMDSHTSKSYKLSWDITDKDTIYVGRNDFYILPSIDQKYNDEFGNDKLQPAYGRTTTIGYNRSFSDGNLFTINWYKTESERGIGYRSDGTYENYVGGVARGWNAQYLAQFNEHWSAKIGWAHLYQFASGDTFSLGYYPKNLATFGIYYNKDKFTAGLDGFYFIRGVNPKYQDVQGWPDNKYGVYNLSLSYAPNENLMFYSKIDNIFDKLWAEHTHVIWGGGPRNWYSQPGRSIMIGMQYKF